MNAKAVEARRAYKRKWAKENPDKVKAQQERYWTKRAARAAAEEPAANAPAGTETPDNNPLPATN
jgi:hypothetical protein